MFSIQGCKSTYSLTITLVCNIISNMTEKTGLGPELTLEEQIAYTRAGIAPTVEAGTYIMTDKYIEHLQELGVPLSPLESLNLRIQSRVKYAQVVSKDEMLMNKKFSPELDQLRQKKEDLLRSEIPQQK